MKLRHLTLGLAFDAIRIDRQTGHNAQSPREESP